MKITIFSLFPGYFDSILDTSLLGKAITDKTLLVDTVDIREYATGRHRQCDDVPYGGGPGMVMMPEPIVRAFEAHPLSDDGQRIYMSPRGKRLVQPIVEQHATLPEIQILCGRYEGVDQRVLDHWIDQEISIGDFVLGGGESAAAVYIEAVTRYVPGVLGAQTSLEEESFARGGLEYPHYTRPAEFRGHQVPEVLRSGNHKNINQWRSEQAEATTRERRPDLLASTDTQ